MGSYEKTETLRIMIADLEEKIAAKMVRLHGLQRARDPGSLTERDMIADEIEEEQNLLDLYKRNLREITKN